MKSERKKIGAKEAKLNWKMEGKGSGNEREEQ